MHDPKLIYLKNGEMIVGSFKEESDSLVWFVCPVQVKTMQMEQNGVYGETWVFRPWISLSSDNRFLIAKKDILTFANITSKVTDQYISFVNEYYFDSKEETVEEVFQEEPDSDLIDVLEEYSKQSKDTLH